MRDQSVEDPQVAASSERAAHRGGPFSARGAIYTIVALALIVRIAVIAADGGYVPRQDDWDYNRHAISVAAGAGFPDSYYVADRGPSALRAPAYPYFLAGIYVVSGDSITAGRIANAVLGALVVLLLFLVVSRIWGRRIGLIAAAGAALFPPLVLLSRDLLSESLFIVLELGAVLCVLEFRRLRGMRWAVLAGVVAGLAALTRNPGLALATPMVVGLWVYRPRLSWSAARAPAVALGCMALIVMPWTVRNAIEFGRFVPVTSGTGFAMAGTYNEVSLDDDDHPGSWRTPRVVPEYTPLFVASGIDEGTLDATLRSEATSFALDHPGYVAEVSAWNLLRMFEVTGGSVVELDGEAVTFRGIGSADPPVERIGLGIAGMLALLGIWVIWRRLPASAGRPISAGPFFLWLVPLFLIIVSVPINGLPRQRTPIDPFILILASIGLSWLLDRLAADKVSPV